MLPSPTRSSAGKTHAVCLNYLLMVTTAAAASRSTLTLPIAGSCRSTVHVLWQFCGLLCGGCCHRGIVRGLQAPRIKSASHRLHCTVAPDNSYWSLLSLRWRKSRRPRDQGAKAPPRRKTRMKGFQSKSAQRFSRIMIASRLTGELCILETSLSPPL